ncbi:MAG: matrixin family metalloprotease [Fimbriimonadaceae bacterium]
MDSRIQPRVHEFLDRAERCLTDGKHSEARTVAEMLLLRRDLRYSVELQGLSPEQAQDAQAALSEAMHCWSEALNGAVEFVPATGRFADVRISFVESVRSGGCDVAGHAVWRRQILNWREDQFSYQVSADIHIRTRLPGGSKMSRGMMRHTALHELGHVLGLNDSRRSGDAMSALNPFSPVSQPSGAEVLSLVNVFDQAGMFLSQAMQQDLIGVLNRSS